MSIHSVALGNVGGDAEVRTLQNGQVNMSFSLACSHGFGDSETTTWVNCTMWGERVTKLAPHIKKGQRLAVRGELWQEKWIDKEGYERFSVKMSVDSVDFAGPKPEAGSGDTAGGTGPRRRRAGGSSPQGGGGGGASSGLAPEDDIPF